MKYEPFKKNFYVEHPDIAGLTYDEIKAYRKSLGLNDLDLFFTLKRDKSIMGR